MNSKKTGRSWAVRLIRKLWDVAWDMWDHRNTINNQGTASLALRDIDDAIRHQFALGYQDLLPVDHQFLHQSQASLLTTSPGHWKQWLAAVQEARRRGLRNINATYQAEHDFMANFVVRYGHRQVAAAVLAAGQHDFRHSHHHQCCRQATDAD